MSSALEIKLQKRKLDALRRGIHRIGQDEKLAFSVNVVGIGKAGADVVADVLRSLPKSGPKMAALVIDIGDADLGVVREAAAALPADRADIEIVPLALPSPDDLRATLRHYQGFLTLEYPMFRWTLARDGWLPPALKSPEPGEPVSRAYAKALYGQAYYDGGRKLKAALRRFGDRVEAVRAQSMVGMVFGLGGGTGSGIAVDMARHLTNMVFGRQALTVGIGILPCDGDRPDHRGDSLFAALNELDCLGDEEKNQGVVMACGELFRNPFTAGFLAVPQQHVWESTGDLAKTHHRVTQEISSLLTARGGANLWETLRLLNWVAAPSTQHSAARTPWGPKWIHMLGFADPAGQAMPLTPDLPTKLGLLSSYHPEFIELRGPDPGSEAAIAATAQLEAAFAPDVAPQSAAGGRDNSIQFVLPSISKTDLAAFFSARAAYDAADHSRRLLDHALLLDQGVMLSEPSTRLAGMAGASLPGSDGWVAVPFDVVRGGEPASPERPAKIRVAQADALVA